MTAKTKQFRVPRDVWVNLHTLKDLTHTLALCLEKDPMFPTARRCFERASELCEQAVIEGTEPTWADPVPFRKNEQGPTGGDAA